MTRFSIVAFNNQVMVWKKNLVPATLASKQRRSNTRV